MSSPFMCFRYYEFIILNFTKRDEACEKPLKKSTEKFLRRRKVKKF